MGVSSMANRSARAFCASVLGFALCAAGCASDGLTAGQGAGGPWWMQQTALTADGKLNLRSKPWWDRAMALKVGESFVIEAIREPAAAFSRDPQGSTPEAALAPARSDDAPAGYMLVGRERFRNRSREVEAIVWVIDDDADGSLTAGGDPDPGGPGTGSGRGDKDSDCYVVDYGCDGVVDRMVDYIDNDGDDDPDEMDIRYFVDGELCYTWFGMDLDDDSAMWSLRGYEYGGPSFFESDPYGNSMVYMNKLNTEDGTWFPISECPFAFYDTDGDAYSEVAVRVSAVPIGYDPGVDPDYANDYQRFRAKWSKEMERMGVVNIRYSFDVDNLSAEQTPLHYDFGFNLVGETPYEFSGMAYFNPKRRPPQVTQVIPYDRLREISDRYEAQETGFTWHEQHDDTISIGYGEHKDLDYRWEGVFWTWERRFMGNTGGPGQKWNVRREWSSTPTDRRELYYSEVDRRIHLFKAEEGWIQVGHFGGQNELGEVRMFDTDGNGYFDRWEVYKANHPVPVRVSTVRDEKAKRIPFDYESLSRFYTRQVLPGAMAANARLMAAMRDVCDFEIPPGLAAAMETGSPNVRRFAQDVVREMQYQELRQHLTAEAHRGIREAKMDDLRQLKTDERETTKNSYYAWRLIRSLEKLDVAYGQGDFDAACVALDEIADIEAPVNR